VERLGSTKTQRVDVRIVAATNKDLRKQVEKGNFREDLYYRLNVVHLHLPPLRERKEDIPELCSYLLRQIGAEIGKLPALVSAEAMNELLRYDWPGNVRELRNVLARAVVTAPTSVILCKHLSFEGPEMPSVSSPGSDLCPFVLADLDRYDTGLYDLVVGEVERRLLAYALKRTGGNKVHTARLLGVSRNKLTDRMERFDLGGGNADQEGDGGTIGFPSGS
jgi:DNA-binding NtrC family response regulator